MHPIRKDILRRLVLHSRLRFAQLKPEDVESNHFMYYLKQLMDEGLVAKQDGFYILTDEGRHWAGIISLDSLTPRLQPKIMTAQIIYDGGRVLIHRRSREPYSGNISLVNGKLHYGERITEAAQRELSEKTGLRADMYHVGMVYLIYTRNGEPTNHTFSHIFTGTNPHGEMTATKHSEPFWVEEDKVADLDNILPGTLEILELIRNAREPFFFAEYEFESDA